MEDQKIRELISQGQWIALRDRLVDEPPPDIADLLMQMRNPDRILIFRLLPRQIASEAFSYLEPSYQDTLLTDLTDEETRYILTNLSPDDRTDFLEELPGQAIQRLLNLLRPEDFKETRLLLGYPEESVGRLMTPDYIAVRRDWTIKQSLEHIRKKGRDSETIDVVYVTDAAWKLLDAIDLRRFILSDPTETVEQIMDYSFVSILVSYDREEAVHLMQHYDLIALPVVDSEGVLLGIVTIDDVLDVVEEETTEDFHKTAAVEPLKTSYRESTVWRLYRNRIIWLATLLGVNLFSSGVIAVYEETLASAIALVFFIPLLMASGGNVGAQSSTLIVRAIATQDITLNQWLWTITRELCIGLLLGGTMATVIWLLGLFRSGFEIAIIVSVSMVLIVLVANILGVAVPLILTRFKLDPAVASSPLITSIADVTCLMIYFAIATRVLG